MSTARQFLRNLFSNWAGMVFGMLIAFFLAPYVVRKLGNTYYGVWTIVMDLTGYLGLLEMGVRQSVIRYVAKYQAENDPESMNRVAGSALTIYGFTSAACVLVSLGLAAAFPFVFKISADLVPTARWVVVITGLNIAQGLAFSVYYGIILGHQRYDVVFKVNTLGALVKAALTVALLSNGLGIVALGLMHLAVGLASNLYALRYCARNVPGLAVRPKMHGSEWYRRIFTYGFKTFVMFLGQRVVHYSDSLLIGIVLGPAHVTFFVIGASLTEYMRMLVNQMTQIFTPLTSELQARRAQDKIEAVLMHGTKLSLLIALPIAVVFLTMGRRFISLWMGEEYGPRSGDVLLVMTVTHLFGIAQYTTQDILQGLNKHHLSAIFRSVEAVANLLLSLALIQHWGIVGVAVGTAVPHLAIALFAYPWAISRIVRVDLRRYLARAYLFPIASAVPFLLGCLALEARFPAASLAGFFARVLLLLPLWALSAWCFALDRDERSLYLGFIRGCLPGRAGKPGTLS